MERIVLVAPKLELRGATIYTLMLAKELKLRGYRVAVMAGSGPFADELLSERIPFIRADISGVLIRDLLYLRHYTKLLQPFRPDLIHITHHHLAGLGALIARNLKTPYILTILNPLKRAVPFQNDYLQGAIAISQPVRQSAVNTGLIPREKVHIIENGVVTGLNPPVKTDSGLIPVVGTVGRLEKDRGIKYFIHAARELVNRKVQAHFLVLGAGPEEAKIRKLTRALEITEHVTINRASSNYKSLMDPIDIYVSPALSEGFGLFVMRAMAAAIPVVASAAGGVFSLITDNETGLIVPKRDASLFADKIQAFLDDRAFAESIGLNGFHYVQSRFSYQKNLEKTLKLYHHQELELEE
ncbi:MAG: glycosyltransferase family 4 protein [Planctomycetota bacterium]